MEARQHHTHSAPTLQRHQGGETMGSRFCQSRRQVPRCLPLFRQRLECLQRGLSGCRPLDEGGHHGHDFTHDVLQGRQLLPLRRRLAGAEPRQGGGTWVGHLLPRPEGEGLAPARGDSRTPVHPPDEHGRSGILPRTVPAGQRERSGDVGARPLLHLPCPLASPEERQGVQDIGKTYTPLCTLRFGHIPRGHRQPREYRPHILGRGGVQRSHGTPLRQAPGGNPVGRLRQRVGTDGDKRFITPHYAFSSIPYLCTLYSPP